MNPALRSSLSILAETARIEAIKESTHDGRKALGELVMQHRGEILAVVAEFAEIPEADRDDLFQEVWIFIYRNINRYTGEVEFRTWIIAVTRHTCEQLLSIEDPLRHADRNALESDGEDGNVSLNAPRIPHPMMLDLDHAMRGYILDGIQTALSEPERETVEYIMQDLSPKEIAEEMGCEESIFQIYRDTAFKKLREYVASRTAQ